MGSISRRRMLVAAGAVAATTVVRAPAVLADQVSPRTGAKMAVSQSVCAWCFKKIPLEQLCVEAAKLGLVGIDLVSPNDYPTLKKHNLIATMTGTHGLTAGLNNKANHGKCLDAIKTAIEAAAEAGFPNVITFSGNRNGMADDEGARNCVEAL